MEDQILRLFEENEALEKEVRRQEKEVERLSAGLRLEKERSRNETVNVTQEHLRVSQERTVVSNLIHQEVLAEYEKLRKRRSGLAVVVVHSDICPGCHMAIPFQTINEVLQTGEIRHCPYCRRILFCGN
jgi:predicted  nucleic acid-binding Zn-ribbon protein